jgi:hypothetical protein
VHVEGAVPDHPPLPEEGGVELVVIWYPVTPTMSSAVNEVIGMFRLIEGVVAPKAITLGAIVSTTTVLGVPNTADTLPEASLAQGYNTYVPSKVTKYVGGAVVVQLLSPANGGVGEVVIL